MKGTETPTRAQAKQSTNSVGSTGACRSKIGAKQNRHACCSTEKGARTKETTGPASAAGETNKHGAPETSEQSREQGGKASGRAEEGGFYRRSDAPSRKAGRCRRAPRATARRPPPSCSSRCRVPSADSPTPPRQPATAVCLVAGPHQ